MNIAHKKQHVLVKATFIESTSSLRYKSQGTSEARHYESGRVQVQMRSRVIKTGKYYFQEHKIRKMPSFLTLFLDGMEPFAVLTVCADKQKRGHC